MTLKGSQFRATNKWLQDALERKCHRNLSLNLSDSSDVFYDFLHQIDLLVFTSYSFEANCENVSPFS